LFFHARLGSGDEIDPSLIITSGRRTRGKKVDYSALVQEDDDLYDEDDD